MSTATVRVFLCNQNFPADIPVEQAPIDVSNDNGDDLTRSLIRDTLETFDYIVRDISDTPSGYVAYVYPLIAPVVPGSSAGSFADVDISGTLTLDALAGSGIRPVLVNNAGQIFAVALLAGMYIDPDFGATTVKGGDFEVAGNMTVAGDLTVNGTTTTVNSTVVDIADRLIHLNSHAVAGVAVPALIAGIEVERGDTAGTKRAGASILWRESTSLWQFALNTAADDSTVGADLAIRALGATLSGLGGSGAGYVAVDNAGLLSFVAASSFTLGGDVTGAMTANHVDTLTGTGGFITLTDGSAIKLSSTGTHYSASALLQTKYYANQVLWGGRYGLGGGNDGVIVKQVDAYLIFGDENAWNPTSIRGQQLQFYASTGLHSWLGASAITNMTLTAEELSVGSSTHFQARLRPWVSNPSTAAALHLIDPGTASTGSNFALLGDGANLYLNAPNAVGHLYFFGGNANEFADFTYLYAKFMVPIWLDAASGTFPSIGQIRAKESTTIISARSNGGDRGFVSSDAYGTLILGADASSSSVVGSIQLTAIDAWGFYKPGVSTFWYMTPGDYTMQFYYTGAAPTMKQRGMDSNSAPYKFTIAGQDAYASATGTNQRGGSVAVLAGANKAGYTTTKGGVEVGSVGDTVATVGTLRGASDFSVYGKTSGAVDTLFMGYVSGQKRFGDSNDVTFIDTSSLLYMGLNSGAYTWYLYNCAQIVQFTNGQAIFYPYGGWYMAAAITPVFEHYAAGSDVATRDITWRTQAPFATATGTNRRPGHFIVDIPLSISTPSHNGGFAVSINNSKIIEMGEYADSGNAYGAVWFGSSARAMSTTNWSFLGGGGQTYFNTPGAMFFGINGAYYWNYDAAAWRFGTSYATPQYILDLSATAVFHFGVDATSAKIKYDDRTTDAATHTLAIIGQGASAGSTGSNREGGKLSLRYGANKAGYTSTSGGIEMGLDGAPVAANGDLRVSNSFFLAARNNANTGDIAILQMSGDNVVFGDGNGGSCLVYYPATTSFELFCTGTLRFQADNYIAFGSAVGGVDAATGMAPSSFAWLAGTIDVTSVGSANVTATNSQAANVILKANGSPSATRNVILPDVQGSYYIVWNASGQTVNWRKSGGSGVTTPNGQVTSIFHDGTDYRQIAQGFP